MRISDWSSDVCSSDLGGHIVQYGKPEAIVLNPANEYVAEFVAHMNPLNVLRGGSLMTLVEELKREGDAVLLDRAGRFRVKLNEIGRASCRERVCQYV